MDRAGTEEDPPVEEFRPAGAPRSKYDEPLPEEIPADDEEES